MFYSLTGKLVHYDEESIAIDCGGVAYLCTTTLSTLTAVKDKAKILGETVTVYTHLNVRDNAVDLFGFSTKTELNCFKLLTTVSGIGPKVGISILSSMTPDQVMLSIAADDYKALTVAPGVGRKLAQRVVLELRDKVQNEDLVKAVSGEETAVAAIGSGNITEAISALVVLGYSQTQAASALGGLSPETPIEELIKAALKKLAK